MLFQDLNATCSQHLNLLTITIATFGHRVGNMYKTSKQQFSLFSIKPHANPLCQLHVRIGHLSPTYLCTALLNKSLLISPYSEWDSNKLKKQLKLWLANFPVCATCGVSKLRRLKIDKVLSEPAVSTLHTLHIDRCGPSLQSKEGYRYWLPIVDAYSSYVIPLFTRDASGESLANEFSRVIGSILLRLRRIGIYYINYLKSDNEQSIISGEMKRVCESLGIKFYPTSAPHRSQQNGKAERAIRTITEMVRANMQHYGAPKSEWVHATRHACHHLNRIPRKMLDYNTPYNLFWKAPTPGLNYLRPFYCPVFCKTDAPTRKLKRFLPVGFLGNLW